MHILKYISCFIILPLFAAAQQSPFIDRSTLLNAPQQYGNYGTAVIDFNNDGWEDIFIANVPYLSGTDTSYCILLKNNMGENFTNVALSAGIRNYGSYKCGVWGDVNNDGYPDLFIGEAFQHGRSRLYINNTNGTFRDAGPTGIDYTAMASTAAFGDYDNDGRIDLFIATEYPEFDLLYRNTSVGDSISFVDVTSAAGVGGFSSTAPMQVTFIDIDHDGDQDIYAVHDGFLPSNLFRNNGDGSFTDISFQSGLYDYGAGNSMGVYWKDFDGDGWEEVYVSRIGKGGLYKRQLDGTYKNIADTLGAEFNGMSWGIVWEDFDNDADDDIFTVNNYGFNSVRSLYYENINGKFVEKAAEYGINFAHAFYGLAYGDFNNDGYLDLVASATDGNNKLLLNTKNRSGNWMKLSLTGTVINRMAVGATVRIVAGSRSQRRTVTAGNSYASQMSHALHFGVGSLQVIDTVEVNWSKEHKQIFTNISVNTHYRLVQGSSLVTSAKQQSSLHVPQEITLYQNYPNPFNPTTVLSYQLSAISHTSIIVYDAIGREVAVLVNEVKEPGFYAIPFDGAHHASGVYFARLTSNGKTQLKKMVLTK